MEYQDTKIAALKSKKRTLDFSDIKGKGVYIDNQFIKFQEISIFQQISIYLPEDFVEMPDVVKIMKYTSGNRPEVIKTSLDTTVNFAFNLFEDQIGEHEIKEFAGQLKGVIKTVNPSVRMLEERKGFTIQNRAIEMFDFISSGVDDQLYNMMCFIPFSDGTLHVIFNCLNKDSEDWKEIAWQAILTLEEETKRS